MGRVFSHSEVITDQVPTLADFRVTAEVFDANCVQAINAGTLVGSVVYGSAAIDRATRRSDFDCMLVTDGTPWSLQAARRIIIDTASATKGRVELSPIAYSRDVLASGRHEIDRFFGQHLTGDGRVVRGEDVADFITYDGQDAVTTFNDYARNKKRRLASAYVSAEPEVVLKGLQRLTELPLAIGRKLVKVVDEVQELNKPVINTADKPLIRAQVLKLLADMSLEATAIKLLDADADYSLVLHNTLADCVDYQGYRATIEWMHKLIPAAIDWIDTIDRTLPEYLASS